MSAITETASIIYGNTTTNWGGFFSENGILILTEVFNKEGKAESISKETIDNILMKITNYQERTPAVLKELLASLGDTSSSISLIIGFLNDNKFCVGSKGFGNVLLVRKGRLGKILSDNDVSSGGLEAGDKILFGNKKFSGRIDTRVMADQLLMDNDLKKTAEGFKSALSGNEDAKGAAALLIYYRGLIKANLTEKKKINSFFSIIPSFRQMKGKLKLFWDRISNIADGREEELEDPEQKKSKQRLLIIALALIIILFISVFLNINTKNSQAKQKILADTLDLISHQYDEAQSLVDLNPLRSRSLLSDSKISLNALFGEFPKNSEEAKKIKDWLGRISEMEVTAYKIYKLTAVPLFFDLSFVKQGGSGTKMARFGETKAILDTANKVIYVLSTDTKQASIVAGEDTVKNTDTIAVYGKNVFIVNDDGLVAIDIVSKTSRILFKPDEKWGSISALDAYGGNLYLLDSKNFRIWKYIATEDGFTPIQSYLNPDVRIDLSSATQIVIDGSVWVLNGGSDLLKFSRGLSEAFSFKGFSETFHDLPSFSTGEKEKNIYLLDKSNSRIVVFAKDGTYDSQYQWEELSKANDLLASEEEKKIFVLSASKIFAIDIQ